MHLILSSRTGSISIIDEKITECMDAGHLKNIDMLRFELGRSQELLINTGKKSEIKV